MAELSSHAILPLRGPSPPSADLCTSPLVASSIMMTTSEVRATAITWRPRPFPKNTKEVTLVEKLTKNQGIKGGLVFVFLT